MNNKYKLFSFVSWLLLSQGITTLLAAPINPTESDFGNTAGGSSALINLINGTGNTAFGNLALYKNTNGNYNSAFGVSALEQNITGTHNTALAAHSLIANTTGSFNIGLGVSTLASNTEGSSNIAIGRDAMIANTTGGNNTSVGEWSLYNNTLGNGNTALGYHTFLNKLGGNNNLALGISAGVNLKTGNNNVYIASAGVTNESNTIRVGSAGHTKTIIGGIRGKTVLADAVPVVIDSTGRLGTVVSSERFKKDIQDMKEASRNLLKLRPVIYHYKQMDENGDNRLEYGLIAEEVAKVYPDLVAYGADGKIETVQYQKLTPMLLNEVQRLNRVIEASQQNEQHLAAAFKAEQLKNQEQTQVIAELKAQLGDMKLLSERLSRLEARQVIAANR